MNQKRSFPFVANSPKRLRYSSPEEKRSRDSGDHAGVSTRLSPVQHHLRQRGLGSNESVEPTSIGNWVSRLPDSPQEFDEMPQPPMAKRTRSTSNTSDASVPSDSETVTTISRETKYSIYQNSRYPQVMESKGSYMRDSPEGPLQEDIDMYKRLLTEAVPLPSDPLWEPELVPRVRSLLQNKSELRVCIDLHPRLVPSSEVLALQHPGLFDNLVEGHNDRWTDAVLFYNRLPQPDRTKAYHLSAFTDDEKRKLGASPESASWFTTRAGMLFPYFTCEVKCGREALTIADRANLNSMTIALRIVVELYRRAGTVMSIHRRILAFSMSHDDGQVRIYGHYPHIDGDNTTYWRRVIRDFSYADLDARERTTAYTFVWNVDTIFAPFHLKRLKEAINRLPDPLARQNQIETSSVTAAESEHEPTPPTPLTSSSDVVLDKPMAAPRMTIAKLAQQLERQHGEFSRQLTETQKEIKELRDENKVLRQENKDLQKENKDLLKQLLERR